MSQYWNSIVKRTVEITFLNAQSPMHFIYFSHANVVNTSKCVYEIFENFVIKFNNTSRTNAIRFVSENEWKKEETDACHRQLVHASKRKRENERKREVCAANSILFYFISSNSNSILCFISPLLRILMAFI